MIDFFSISSRLNAWKLGYRWSYLELQDKQTVENLIVEILTQAKKKHILRAFLEGKFHAENEKKSVLRNINSGIDKDKPLETQDTKELKEELNELSQMREKNKDKSQDKSR